MFSTDPLWVPSGEKSREAQTQSPAVATTEHPTWSQLKTEDGLLRNKRAFSKHSSEIKAGNFLEAHGKVEMHRQCYQTEGKSRGGDWEDSLFVLARFY
ncbi:mCG1050159 [Mus musculus]|jgi:hypothetical protein|nr:mCG1050159 [Mus musculus]